SEVEGAMDWRSAIRKHPYIAMGTALAVGYFVVPRRRRRVERIVEGVQPLVEAAAMRGYAPERPEKPPKSLGRKATGWAIGLLWPLVSQPVQAYAAMWLESQLKQHLNLQPPHPDDAPPPAGKSGDSYGGDAVYRMPKRG